MRLLSNLRFNKLGLTLLLLIGSLFYLGVVGADDTTNTLPDLGRPAANTGSVQPSMSAQGAGFTYHDNIDGKQIILTPQYNQQNGTSIGGSLAGALSKNMAVGVLLSVGSDKNEWLLNTGFDLTSNQRFIFSLGQLRQKQDFNFISGRQKAQIRQDNGAVSYQYFLGKNFLNAAEINAYISDTGSVTLGDKTYFTDTTSLYELWSDPRRIAGGRVTGAQGRLVFTPTSKSTLKLGFGGERLTYDLLTGNDSTTRATGSAEFNQRLDYGFNLRASANAGASQNRYALGVGKSFMGGSQLGLDVATIQGRDNTFNDNQVMLSYTQNFGGGAYAGNPLDMNNSASNNHALSNLDAAGAPMNPAPVNMAAPNPTAADWASSLVDQVSRRPSFLPAQVVAKIDTTATPTRLIAIDKTALPIGSTVATDSGVITTPLGISVIAIVGVTRDGINFTNNGQFALSGTTNFVINPGLIQQPASGAVEIYVVTMSNTGGGTTLATITVSHGSTHIDSVVISQGLIVPVLSAITLSPSGYLVFGATAPTFVLPTSASSGAISYTSSSTDVATIDSNSGIITIVGTGISTITATQVANGNYATASTTATLKVDSATPSLSNFAAISKTYGDATFSLTAPTSASSGAFTYTSSDNAVATISGSTVTIVGTGTSNITATQAANGNYGNTTAATTLTVTAATPNLSNFGAISKIYGDAAFNLTAPTSASSGAFTYTSSNTAVATISGSTVTMVGVGTSTITATQAANGNYASASTTATLTVTATDQSTLTVNASPLSIVVLTGTSTLSTTGGSGTGAVTYTTTGDCTISGTTLTAGATLGTCTVTATKAADSNHTSAVTGTVNIAVTVIGTQATPTFSPVAGAVSFNNTPVTITSTSATAIYYTTDGTTPTTSSTNQATTPLVINAGVTVKALAVRANYTNSSIGSATYTQAAASAPSAITLAVGSVGAVSGVTNVAIPAAGTTDTTGAVAGWVAATSDKIKFTVIDTGGSSTITINGALYNSGADYQITAAGTLSIVVTTTEAGKTTGVRTFAVAVVTPSLGAFSVASKTYGDANFALTPPSTNSLGAFTYNSSNAGVATISGSTVTIVGAGSSTITVSQAANGNYAAASTTATLTINKATPIIAAISNINVTSADYIGICIAKRAADCYSGYFYVPYSVSNGSSNDIELIDTLTSNDLAILKNGVVNFGAGGYFDLVTFFVNNDDGSYTFSDWLVNKMNTPQTATMTYTRAATTNFNAASTSFTVTLTAVSGPVSGYVPNSCSNNGLLYNSNAGRTCACQSCYTGIQCDQPDMSTDACVAFFQ